MRKSTTALLLKPEYVPVPLSGFSAFRLLRNSSSWKNIREAEIEKARNRCCVCGFSRPPLYCHEHWQYRDTQRLAVLVRFAVLCHRCNYATHADLAAAHGKHYVAIAQLCTVNRITKAEAEWACKLAWLRRDNRRNKCWKVSVSRPLLRAYPQLRILEKTPVRSAVGLW